MLSYIMHTLQMYKQIKFYHYDNLDKSYNRCSNITKICHAY